MRRRTFTFAPLTIEYVGDKIEGKQIKGHSKAAHDLVVGDHCSVSDLTILEVHDEGAMEPGEMTSSVLPPLRR